MLFFSLLQIVFICSPVREDPPPPPSIYLVYVCVGQKHPLVGPPARIVEAALTLSGISRGRDFADLLRCLVQQSNFQQGRFSIPKKSPFSTLNPA